MEKSVRTTRGLLRLLSGASIYAVAVFALPGCPENRGSFTPAPQLRFAGVTSSAGTAEIGELVQVEWNFENEELLTAQRARLINLSFEGLSALEFIELPLEERFLDFEYFGPCMLEIVCDDEFGEADRVAFEIRPDETPFLQATVRNGVNGYPRLGTSTQRERTIDFQQFFGAFDPAGNPNGLLDDIAQLALPTGLPFRALSFSPNESEAFDLRQGSAYPLLSALDPTLGVANAVLYGGGFSYDGEIFDVKTADGNVEGTRGATSYEKIFLCVVLQVFKEIPPVIVDIQLGNLSQGAVVSLTNYGIGGRSVGSSQFLVNSNLNQNGDISGSIKGTVLGLPVTDLFGSIFTAFVQVDNISFSMPFLRDDQLDTRLFFIPSPV